MNARPARAFAVSGPIQVERHIAAGDLDAAALVLGVSTSKAHGFQESYQSLQQKLRAEGADSQRSLRRDAW